MPGTVPGKRVEQSKMLPVYLEPPNATHFSQNTWKDTMCLANFPNRRLFCLTSDDGYTSQTLILSIYSAFHEMERKNIKITFIFTKMFQNLEKTCSFELVLEKECLKVWNSQGLC